MKSFYSPAIWRKLQDFFSAFMGYSPSATLPLVPDTSDGDDSSLRRNQMKSLLGLTLGINLILWAGSSLLPVFVDLQHLHLFSVIFGILFVDVVFLFGTLACRPLYDERFTTKERTRLISPIAATYLLIGLLVAVVEGVSHSAHSAFGCAILGFLSGGALLTLLLFERDQTRLAIDEKTRHEAILLNGEVVSDGAPTGFLSSFGTLVILVIAGFPGTIRRVYDAVARFVISP